MFVAAGRFTYYSSGSGVQELGSSGADLDTEIMRGVKSMAIFRFIERPEKDTAKW